MPAPWPLLYRVYAAGGRFALPVLRSKLTKKHLAEGGAASRVGERFGHATAPRPGGPLIWVHAVSIGEAMSVLELCGALTASAQVLLTTTTVSSANMIADRLPPGVLHQFSAIDVPQVMGRFLDHWRPDLAVITESEIWPVALHALDRRGTPVAVVNGRLSEKSARGWARLAPRVGRAALSRLKLVMAQDTASCDRFVALGAPRDRTMVTGSLKSAAARLPVDQDAKAAAAAWAGGRPLWLAASTHAGEEEVILAAHDQLRGTYPNALLVLAPRHDTRANDVAQLIKARGMAFAQRSAAEVPGPDTAVYLADTIGEMGVWFDLCKTVVMGGSLVPGIGGHNPMEPAQFGCNILTGPHMDNARELFTRLEQAGAARVVSPAPTTLAAALAETLDQPRQDPGQFDEAGALPLAARRLTGLL